MALNFLYETFHKNTKNQSKVIADNNFTYRIIISIINSYITTKKEILDIGCGAGTLCFYLANRGNQVVGIDISNTAIRACKKSAEILNLNNKVRFDVINFPNRSPKGEYDFVILTEVIEHLKDDNLALRKIFSLLKKGGIVIISTPSKNAPLYKLRFTDNFDKRVGHLRRYTVEELAQKCKNAGFLVINSKKTEGIIRNFLFLSPVAGKLVRYIKFYISDFVTFFDNISLKLLGESNVFIIAQKPL